MRTKTITVVALAILFTCITAYAEILRNLTALTGAGTDSANDRLLINDDSANTDKSITITEFVAAIADDTSTLTNKRVTSRVETITVNTTPAPDELTQAGDSYDGGIVTALAADTKIMNPTGTPTDGQKLWLRIKSTTARTLTWDTQYRFSTDMPQPTATSGSSLTDYMVFQWNAADSRLDCVGKNFGF